MAIISGQELDRPGSLEDRCAAAEKEALAQLAIIRALGKLKDRSRQERVMRAVSLVCAADEFVPGILPALAVAMAARSVK